MSARFASGRPWAMFCQMGARNSSVSCNTKLIWSRNDRIVNRLMSVPSTVTVPETGS
jgi:hypothetical protein